MYFSKGWGEGDEVQSHNIGKRMLDVKEQYTGFTETANNIATLLHDMTRSNMMCRDMTRHEMTCWNSETKLEDS